MSPSPVKLTELLRPEGDITDDKEVILIRCGEVRILGRRAEREGDPEAGRSGEESMSADMVVVRP